MSEKVLPPAVEEGEDIPLDIKPPTSKGNISFPKKAIPIELAHRLRFKDKALKTVMWLIVIGALYLTIVFLGLCFCSDGNKFSAQSDIAKQFFVTINSAVMLILGYLFGAGNSKEQ